MRKSTKFAIATAALLAVAPMVNHTTKASAATGVVTVTKETNVYNMAESSRAYTNHFLQPNTRWKVFNTKVVDGFTWYEVGKNQWINLNNWTNVSMASQVTRTVENLKVLHPTTVFSAANVNSSTSTQIAPGTYHIKYQIERNRLTWYQLDNGTWISPAYEFTKNWTRNNGRVDFPILMYHNFDENQTDNTWNVPFSQFKNQMSLLKQNGYHTLTTEEAYYVLTTDRKPAGNIVWLTMDDGYQTWNNVNQFLAQNNLKATGFQITSKMNNSWSLKTNQLQTMNNQAIDIQSHTVSHKKLADMDVNQQYGEFLNSYNLLSSVMNKTMIATAYPFGNYNEATAEVSQQAGYWLSVRMNGGLASNQHGTGLLNRITVRPNLTNQQFLNLLRYGK